MCNLKYVQTLVHEHFRFGYHHSAHCGLTGRCAGCRWFVQPSIFGHGLCDSVLPSTAPHAQHGEDLGYTQSWEGYHCRCHGGLKPLHAHTAAWHVIIATCPWSSVRCADACMRALLRFQPSRKFWSNVRWAAVSMHSLVHY